MPVDLYNQINVVEKEVVKETVSNKLVKFVNAVQTTDTSNLVKKADYDIKLAKLNRKYLMMINILLLLSLIS